MLETCLNFVAWYKEWNYGTFAEGATYIRLGGHHVGNRPAFYSYVILRYVVLLNPQAFQPKQLPDLL